MNRKWNYFLASAVFAGFFLIKGGVPPVAVLAGIGGASLMMLRKKSPSV
jgi:hypothetical protein